METDPLEIQKDEIKKKYNKLILKAVATGFISMLLSLGSEFYRGIRPNIAENPYRNAKSVIEHKLTSEEMKKIKQSREELTRLYNQSKLGLSYVPKDLEQEIEELSNKIKLKELVTITERYAAEEERAKAKLDALGKNELVKKYNNWNNGKDLDPLTYIFLGILGSSAVWANIIGRIRKKKLSELEKKVV